MLDFITRRRLIVIILAVCFVLLSILFVGRIIPSSSKYSSVKSEEDKEELSECYLTEPHDILTLCQKCTSYDRRSKANACLPTGYREIVLCSKSNIKTSRSCQIPISIQRKHFWFFESFVFVLGLFAVASVHSRQKTLDKQMNEKIKRQIGENNE